MNDNSKALISFLILISAGLFIYLNYKKVDNSIDKNKFITVGKIHNIISTRSYTHAEYFYFYRKKKYYGTEPINNSGKKYLNKYYIVNLSKDKPDYSRISFNKEITDKSILNKAGFN